MREKRSKLMKSIAVHSANPAARVEGSGGVESHPERLLDTRNREHRYKLDGKVQAASDA